MPKFQQFIQLVSNQSTCDGLFLELQDCFDLNVAVGEQLTILGEIVGVPRNVFGINPYADYFNFTRATTEPASNGFNRATTLVDTEYFQRAQVNYTYTLTDQQLFWLIQLKVIFNNTYSSFSALKNALWNTYQGGIDIVAPDAGYTYFNFTRATSEPSSIGFNRTAGDPSAKFNDSVVEFNDSTATFNDVKSPTPSPPDTYHFLRSADYWSGYYGSALMQLSYTVKEPYYVTMQIAKFLNIIPHSSGVNQVLNYV